MRHDREWNKIWFVCRGSLRRDGKAAKQLYFQNAKCSLKIKKKNRPQFRGSDTYRANIDVKKKKKKMMSYLKSLDKRRENNNTNNDYLAIARIRLKLPFCRFQRIAVRPARARFTVFDLIL